MSTRAQSCRGRALRTRWHTRVCTGTHACFVQSQHTPHLLKRPGQRAAARLHSGFVWLFLRGPVYRPPCLVPLGLDAWNAVPR